MQTFLPVPDFRTSLDYLDNKRLGKQRVPALKLYHDIAIRVWKERGFKNTMKEYNEEVSEFPGWLGDEAFHASHRSNLLRKDPEFYGRYGWNEPPDLPYIWPSASASLQRCADTECNCQYFIPQRKEFGR